MLEKKFATAAEADAFEKKLFPLLVKLNPQVKRPPHYPDRSHSYIGETRAERFYSIEREQGSMFRKFALADYKNSVGLVTFDKKNKAKGCLLSTSGDSGTILSDQGAIVIAVHQNATGAAAKVKALLPTLLDPKVRAKAKPKAVGKIALDGRTIVYDSAFSAGELARVNWNSQPFSKGAAAAFAKSGGGPLMSKDSRHPCGAFLSLLAGTYTAYSKEEMSLGGGDLQVFWLVRG